MAILGDLSDLVFLWFPVDSNRGCLRFRSETEKDGATSDASDGMTSDGVYYSSFRWYDFRWRLGD